MADRAPEVTQILQAINLGDPQAKDRLISAIYHELREMAARAMRGERADHTLQATALVHEAYLRLLGSEVTFENRAHFFASAAAAMRRILIDNARRKRAQKRGGDQERVTLRDVVADSPDNSLDLLALNKALDELESLDPRLVEVAQLRYFIGLSIEETAKVLGTSPATVKRDWTYARAWLFDRMRGID